jgi:hypothetical protein
MILIENSSGRSMASFEDEDNQLIKRAWENLHKDPSVAVTGMIKIEK